MFMEGAVTREIFPILRDLQYCAGIRHRAGVETIEAQQCVRIDIKPPGDAVWKLVFLQGIGLRNPRGGGRNNHLRRSRLLWGLSGLG